MTRVIDDLTVRNFRSLEDLEIKRLGRVNLITGKNNSGKSSLLEAIRVLVTGGALRTFYDILSAREELRNSPSLERTVGVESTPVSNFFFGFPRISNFGEASFHISSSSEHSEFLPFVKVNLGWLAERVETDRGVIYEPFEKDIFGVSREAEVIPALEIANPIRKRTISLDSFLRRRAIWSRSEADIVKIPCVYLDPFSSRSTGQLSALWDAVALTDVEREIVDALRIISDDIQAISMVGSEGGGARTAIAKSSNFDVPMPLRTFGDGVNRLLGIILSLCNARDGVLLVDEIENGLHYSVQKDIWKTIFRLARNLNVQVFATSHSWDCVSAFQHAAAGSDEEGMLIRLTRYGGRVIPTLFSELELEIATRDQIEVR